MRKALWSMALLGYVTFVVGCAETKKVEPAADAAKKGANVDTGARKASPGAEAVVHAAIANRLAMYGDANKDAISLIAAARILGDLGIQTGKYEIRTVVTQAGAKGDAKVVTAAGSGQTDYTIGAVLARARQYAGGRKDLLALADEAAKSTTRGRAGGPMMVPARVDTGHTNLHTISYRGGEPATVVVVGSPDADFDLVVKDESGNVVCRQTGLGDSACRWTPKWTGQYRVEVANIGRASNQYRVWTN